MPTTTSDSPSYVHRDVAAEHLRYVRDQLAAVVRRWQDDSQLGRLSSYAGCAADVDDVLAALERSLRDLTAAPEADR